MSLRQCHLLVSLTHQLLDAHVLVRHEFSHRPLDSRIALVVLLAADGSAVDRAAGVVQLHQTESGSLDLQLGAGEFRLLATDSDLHRTIILLLRHVDDNSIPPLTIVIS